MRGKSRQIGTWAVYPALTLFFGGVKKTGMGRPVACLRPAAMRTVRAVQIEPDKATPLDGEVRPKDYLSKPAVKGKQGRAKRLTRGYRFLERLGELLVDELDGKAFLEVAHHARLHDAEQDL